MFLNAISFSKKKLLVLIILLIVGVGLFPAPVYADAWTLAWDFIKSGADWGPGKLLSWISEFIRMMVGWFLAGVGLVFDKAIEVALDSSYLNQSYIKDGWVFARNITNIFFIFILLVIAISTILRFEEYGAKRLLAKLIIMALLVNFSFAITRAVIDVSNVAAVSFYNKALTKTTVSNGGSRSITSQLVTNLKLASTIAQSKGAISNTSTAVTFLLGAGLMFITALVLLGGAILFIVRTITFAFLIIISPIAFLASVLPGTQKYFGQWSNELMNQAFFAPIYLFMISIVLDISLSGYKQLDGIAYVDTLNGTRVDLNNYKILFHFLIMTGFIVGAMVVSKSMSGAMGATAVKLGKSVGRRTSGWAGRNTVGRLASAYEGSEFAKNRASSKNRVARTLGAGLLKGSSYVAGASFGGQKGGFAVAQKKRAERQEKYGELLGKGDGGAQRQRDYIGRLKGGDVKRGAAKFGIAASSQIAAKNLGEKLKKREAKDELHKRRESRVAQVSTELKPLQTQKDAYEKQMNEIKSGAKATNQVEYENIQANLDKVNTQMGKLNKEADDLAEKLENSRVFEEFEERIGKAEKKEDGGGGKEDKKEA